MNETTKDGRHSKLAIITGGVVSTLLLASAFSGTLAAFSASITNNNNTAGLAAALSMSETGPGTSGQVTCSTGTDGTATCASINKYGGQTAMVPGGSATTSVTITNTSTTKASAFTLTSSGCSQTGSATATDLCAQTQVKIMSGTTQVYSGSALALRSVDLIALLPNSGNAGAATPFDFTVTFPSTLDNSYAGGSISQPLVWTMSA